MNTYICSTIKYVLANSNLRSVGIIGGTIIAAYAECEHSEEAIECFDQMQEKGASPNSITIVCDLKTCGFSSMVAKCQQIHSEVMLKGLRIEPLVGNTLVFIEHDVHDEALKCFDQMRQEGILPNDITYLWSFL